MKRHTITLVPCNVGTISHTSELDKKLGEGSVKFGIKKVGTKDVLFYLSSTNTFPDEDKKDCDKEDGDKKDGDKKDSDKKDGDKKDKGKKTPFISPFFLVKEADEAGQPGNMELKLMPGSIFNIPCLTNRIQLKAGDELKLASKKRPADSKQAAQTKTLKVG